MEFEKFENGGVKELLRAIKAFKFRTNIVLTVTCPEAHPDPHTAT